MKRETMLSLFLLFFCLCVILIGPLDLFLLLVSYIIEGGVSQKTSNLWAITPGMVYPHADFPIYVIISLVSYIIFSYALAFQITQFKNENQLNELTNRELLKQDKFRPIFGFLALFTLIISLPIISSIYVNFFGFLFSFPMLFYPIFLFGICFYFSFSIMKKESSKDKFRDLITYLLVLVFFFPTIIVISAINALIVSSFYNPIQL